MSLSHPRTLISTSVAVALCLAIASNSNALDITPNTTPFPAPVGKRAETSIAIDPNNPDVMLAAAMPGTGIIVSWTTDGGQSWNQYVAADGTTYTLALSRADPAAAIRARDGLWIVGGLSSDGDVVVYVSRDQGVNWDSHTVKAVGTSEFLDKPHLAVDNDAASPGFGDVYVAWYASDVDAILPKRLLNSPRIEFNRSDWNADLTDGGIAVWPSTAQRLGEDILASTVFQNVFTPNIGVGTSGEVYVAWTLYESVPDSVEDHPKAIGMAMGLPDPTDEHAPLSWGSGYVAVDSIEAPDSRDPNARLGNGWGTVLAYPVLAVDHSPAASGGTIYLTWVGKELTADGSYDIRIASSQPGARRAPQYPLSSRHSGGLNTTQDQFTHWAACDPSNGALGLIYFDRSADPADTMVAVTFSRSVDGGATWEDWTLTDPGVQFTDPENTNAKGREYIGIDGNGGTFAPLWMDARTGGWNVYFSSVTTPLTLTLTNASTGSGIDLVGKTPYTSIPLSYNNDPWEDLAISLRGSLEPLALYQGSDPVFNDIGTFSRDLSAIPSGSTTNSRGVSAADVDNDGDIDLFVGAMESPSNLNADSALLLSTGGSTPTFSDQSTLIQPAGSATDHAWAGSWGDFNADGWLDLYLVRANDHDGTPSDSLGIDGQGLPDVLLAAILDPSTKELSHFRDVTAKAKLHTSDSETIAASWADIDDDGDLDLFACWLGPLNLGSSFGWSPLYLNHGDETFTDVAGFTIGPGFPKVGEVSAVSFADISADSLLDIAVSRQAESPSGPQSNTFVCYNDPSQKGSLTVEPGNGLLGFTPSSSIAIEDLDADGHLDVISAPAVDGAFPTVLLGSDGPSGVQYVNQGLFLGLPPRKADGLTIADFNNDGDLDLYLGVAPPDTTAAEEFLFTSDVSTRTSQISIQVDVNGRDGYSATDGVGARVKVQYEPTGSPSPMFQVRHVDANGGRGTQSPSILPFGVADGGLVKVGVLWPDGTSLRDSMVVSGTSTNPFTMTYPVNGEAMMVANSFSATHIPSTSTTAWTFTWETTNPSIYDEVIINDNYGSRSPCDHFGPNLVLNASNPNVRTWSRKQSNGHYKHVLVWSGMLCVAPCSYTYQVKSWSEVAPGTKTSRVSSQKTLSISICADVQG